MHIWARSRVWVHRIRGSGGGGVGVRVGRRKVGDGTRDTSLGREREGQREWGTHGFPSFLRAPLSWGTLSSLGVGRLARSLFFYSILSIGLSLSFANRVLLHLLRLHADTPVSRAFHMRS